MSFAVMMGSVFLTLGCVTTSRTAGMGQMNLYLVASLVLLHYLYYNYIIYELERLSYSIVCVLYTIFYS